MNDDKLEQANQLRRKLKYADETIHAWEQSLTGDPYGEYNYSWMKTRIPEKLWLDLRARVIEHLVIERDKLKQEYEKL